MVQTIQELYQKQKKELSSSFTGMHWYHLLMAALFFAFFVGMIIFLALTRSFSYDESFTVLQYSTRNLVRIFANDPAIANNHILNSFLIKISSSLFGFSEFALRLPNVITLCLYAVFAWKVVQFDAKHNLHRITRFAVLLCIPIVINSSEARGYGIGMGALMVGFFFFLRYTKTKSSIDIWLAILISGLSVWSTFIFLYVWAACILTFFFSTVHVVGVLKKRAIGKLLNHISKFLAPTLVIIVIVLIPLYNLVNSPNSLFGITTNAIDALVNHTIAIQFYFGTELFNTILAYITIGSLSIGILLSLYSFLKYRKSRYPSISILTAIIVISLLFSEIQNHLIDSPYPTARTAMYYVPLLFVLLVDIVELGGGKLSTYLKRGQILQLGTYVLILALFGANVVLYAISPIKAHWRNEFDRVAYIHEISSSELADEGGVDILIDWREYTRWEFFAFQEGIGNLNMDFALQYQDVVTDIENAEYELVVVYMPRYYEHGLEDETLEKEYVEEFEFGEFKLFSRIDEEQY